MVKAKIRTLGHFTTEISPTTKKTQEGFRWRLKKIHKTLFFLYKNPFASPRNIRFQTTCVKIDGRAQLDWILPFTCALLVNWEWVFSKQKKKRNSTKNLPGSIHVAISSRQNLEGRCFKSKFPRKPRSYYKIKRVPKAFFAFPKFGASHRKEF